MRYDEDILPSDKPQNVMTNEDALRFMIAILLVLMLIIGLPSLFYNVYDNPLPSIVMLGFIAVVLTLFYLNGQLQRMQVS